MYPCRWKRGTWVDCFERTVSALLREHLETEDIEREAPVVLVLGYVGTWSCCPHLQCDPQLHMTKEDFSMLDGASEVPDMDPGNLPGMCGGRFADAARHGAAGRVESETRLSLFRVWINPEEVIRLCRRLRGWRSKRRQRCSPAVGHVGRARDERWFADESYARLVRFLDVCAAHRLGLYNFW